MKRRIVGLLLAVSLLLSLAVGAAAVNCGSYSDWFAVDYDQMQILDLIPDSFAGLDLTKSISRREMCELAVQAFERATGNSIEPERTDYFTDTREPVIVKAYEYGIVNGCGDGTFQPDRDLTRQEFFQIVVNFCTAAAFRATAAGGEINRFRDAGKVADWAVDAANTCVKYTFVRGADDNLMPTSPSSRQEAMTMFLRCYLTVKEYYRVSVLDAEVTVEGDQGGASHSGGQKPKVEILNYATKLYVNTDILNVRDTWSTDGEKVGTVRYGETVKVTGICSNGWYRISYNGEDAYVFGDYLAESPASTPVPIDPHREDESQSDVPAISGSGAAAEIAKLAMSFVGSRYVYGGASPSTGFDCSGLVYYCYMQYGYSMYRVADDQMNQGSAVDRDELQVGDLVFFGSGNYANHVGMYIGNGNFVHASTPSSGVRINALNETYYADRYLGARRIV